MIKKREDTLKRLCLQTLLLRIKECASVNLHFRMLAFRRMGGESPYGVSPVRPFLQESRTLRSSQLLKAAIFQKRAFKNKLITSRILFLFYRYFFHISLVQFFSQYDVNSLKNVERRLQRCSNRFSYHFLYKTIPWLEELAYYFHILLINSSLPLALRSLL